jgi:hypothetical protein
LDNKYQNFKQRTGNEFESMQIFCREMNLKISDLSTKSRPAPTGGAGSSGVGGQTSALVSSQLNVIGEEID